MNAVTRPAFFSLLIALQPALAPGAEPAAPSSTKKGETAALASHLKTMTTTTGFKQLMQAVAQGWNEGDARKAADCYTPDAVYLEPPDKQWYIGRPALYEFFGGARKTEPPMKMQWHHLAFDEASQVGFGEYTFQMHQRYHGIVTVKITGGLISFWREYQYQSDQDWEAFTGRSRF